MRSFTRKTFILFVFQLIALYATSQENNPLVNSGQLMQKGAALQEEKKYAEAIELYKKIDRSDTNYVNALYELSYIHYADSQYERSLEYAKLGLELFPQKYILFGMQAAIDLDEMNRNTEAISLYDSAIKRNPNAYLLHFNKGVVNYKLKNYEEAKMNMQQSIIINPYFASPHYFLGDIYMLQGNLVAAMLALKTYLLIAPSGRYYVNVINRLSSIAKVTDDVLEFVKNKPKSKDDNFSLAEEILLSKVALDKQYKLKAELEDEIVRQIQVVDEKLEFNKNDKGFAMRFYAPFYITTIKEGDFEPMIFSIFNGINNKTIENWNKKNKKEKQAYLNKGSVYFDAIRRTRELDPAQRENSDMYYVYDNNSLIGQGLYSKGKEAHKVGKWDYYHENGALKATGNFNDNGEKEGLWAYYYDNKEIKEKLNYKNGVTEGLAQGWFDNGNKWYAESYLNDKSNGTQNIYYYNDRLSSTALLKENLKNGEVKIYDTKGFLTSVSNYANDKLEGWQRYYHTNGKVKNEVRYINGKEEGTYKSYYYSGTLNIQGEFKEGMRQGLWTTFFEVGTVSEKTIYLDNEITGEFTEYFPNGKLSRKGNYYRKKVDGKLEMYDDDGKIYSDNLFDKGKLREVNFYDKEGKIISTSSTRKGAGKIVFYSAEGIKASEGYFNKEGNRDGKFTFYYSSGEVNEESNWKDGTQDGLQTNYYPGGKIKKTTTYKDGEASGYVKEYFSNGLLSSEGWWIDGSRQQTYMYYNVVGDLISKEYFLSNDLNGYSVSYFPGNKPNIEFQYDHGWLEGVKQYDSSGNIISLNRFEKGKGAIVYKHFNGKIAVKGAYDHYMLNGPYTFYFFDGALSGISFYKNDLRDSVFKTFYPGGGLRVEGLFRDGLKEGLWKYYYANGKIKEEEHYVAGNLEGADKVYMADGSLQKLINYKNNELDGNYDLYGENNQLAVRLQYKEDALKSYQYEEKHGVMTTPVFLKGSTGKIIAKYPNGQTSVALNFADNLLEGERKIFTTTGKIFIEGSRLNGYLNGVEKIYHPDGTLWSEGNYILGNLHGPAKYYYPNGKLEKEENYYNDELHGICKYYNEQGALVKTYTYYHGSLLSIK